MNMEYKIIGGNTVNIVTTDVEFTFEDGTVEVISISHFNPKDDEDIIKGIENRYITEQAARNAKVENNINEGE